MTAQEDAINSLSRSGLRDLLTWAAPVAFAHTNDLYDEDAGHDQGVVGFLNFKHLCDLLDRATANGRFTLGGDVDGTGADVLGRGITPAALQAMPSLGPGAVSRSDYKRSPGWSADGYRVLLQSFTFGKIDAIKWARRSNAKQEIASQTVPEKGATLFDVEDYGLEYVASVPDGTDFEGLTLIAAHAYNPVTGQYEVYIGQSKNPDYRGDSCWHWRARLLSGGTPTGGLLVDVSPVLPGDAASSEVEDIDIQIRKPRLRKNIGSTDV